MKRVFHILVGFFTSIALYILYVLNNAISIFGIDTSVKFKTFVKGSLHIKEAITRVVLVTIIIFFVWLLM